MSCHKFFFRERGFILFCFYFYPFNQGCQFRSVSSGMAETFHTNSKNETKQNNFHPVPDFSTKFRPERSGFIPHVPFRS